MNPCSREPEVRNGQLKCLAMAHDAPQPTRPCLQGCLADDVKRPAQGLPPHNCCI